MLTLKNGQQVLVRLLESGDAAALFQYLQTLSAASKSRFGPHTFDRHTVDHICTHLDTDDVLRYIALYQNNIVAYMLVKHGLIEWDSIRFTQRNQFFDISETATFAPSVLDDWQNTGLGTQMFDYILAQLRRKGYRQVVLWGGVQATNERAVHYYKKLGFITIGSFWHDEKDNYDMVLYL